MKVIDREEAVFIEHEDNEYIKIGSTWYLSLDDSLETEYTLEHELNQLYDTLEDDYV